MLRAALLTHAQNVVNVIAPELRGVHIVYSRIFDGLTLSKNCLGLAIEANQVTFDISERIPGYRPNEPLIVLCDDVIREQSGDDGFRDVVLATLLHECAHLLPRPNAAGRIASVDLSYLDCAAVRARLDERRAEAIVIPEPSPDAADAVHGWRFLRRACHLWSRARLAGWDMPNEVAGDAYWFASQLPHWVAALFPELVRLRNATFAKIESVEPPAEFMRMWRGAISSYHRFREQKA